MEIKIQKNILKKLSKSNLESLKKKLVNNWVNTPNITKRHIKTALFDILGNSMVFSQNDIVVTDEDVKSLQKELRPQKRIAIQIYQIHQEAIDRSYKRRQEKLDMVNAFLRNNEELVRKFIGVNDGDYEEIVKKMTSQMYNGVF